MTANVVPDAAPKTIASEGSGRHQTDANTVGGACSPGTTAWSAVEAVIHGRQSSSPRRLCAPGPSMAQLEALMKAAAAAPDHLELTPWRFVLIPNDRRVDLAEAFREALQERDPTAPVAELDSVAEKAYRSPCLLLAVASMSGPAPISQAERLISLGCAIQNMLLLAQAMGFNSGLVSGRALQSRAFRERFDVLQDELAVCFVNVGTVAHFKLMRNRPLPQTFFSIYGNP